MKAKARLGTFIHTLTTDENDYFERSLDALDVPESDRREPELMPATRAFEDLLERVAREGGYRIETVLYKDDRRVGAVATAVRGVGTVQTGGQVGFHRFDAGLPSIQYSVADVGSDRTALDISTYLTNHGAEQSGPVSVELIVRQADSNIVASRTTVSSDGIDPGETVTPNATVTVPSGYNYYLDAILRKEGTIVDTARSVANLDPQERIEANTTVRRIGLQVEDFERTDSPDPPSQTTGGQPGFGPVVAVVAFLAAAVISWRRHS
jgi:PGF-CTERM protein